MEFTQRRIFTPELCSPERRIDGEFDWLHRMLGEPRRNASHYQSMTHECMYRETFYAKINLEGKNETRKSYIRDCTHCFSDLRAKHTPTHGRVREFFTPRFSSASARARTIVLRNIDAGRSSVKKKERKKERETKGSPRDVS